MYTRILGLAAVGSYIYFTDYDCRELVKVDIKTMKPEKFYPLTEDSKQEIAYSNCIYIEPYLVLIPYKAPDIKVFDMNTESFESYPINPEWNGEAQFHFALNEDDRLFLIPHYYKRMIEFEMAGRKIVYHDILREEDKRGKTPFFRRGCKGLEGILFFCEFFGNRIWSYDTISGKIQKISFGNASTILSNVIDDGKYLYVLPKNETGLYIYQKDTQRSTFISVQRRETCENFAYEMYDCGAYILIGQWDAEYSYIYDKEKMALNIVDLFQNVDFEDRSIFRIVPYSDREIILVLRCRERIIGFWDIASRSVRWERIKGLGKRAGTKILKEGKVVEENREFGLKDYCAFLRGDCDNQELYA